MLNSIAMGARFGPDQKRTPCSVLWSLGKQNSNYLIWLLNISWNIFLA